MEPNKIAQNVYLLTLETFRSSNLMKEKLRDILESSVIESLSECWTHQSVKLRLDLIMKLLVELLNVPRISTLILGMGEIVNEIEKYNTDNLLEKLHALLIEGLTLFKEAEEAMLIDGCDSSLDMRRASLIAKLLNVRVSPVLPYFLTVSENCPNALKYMSCHILRVRALSNELLKVTSDVVTGIVGDIYDNKEVNSSDAFIALVTAHLFRYFKWLRDNAVVLKNRCRNMEIITSVNPSVRAWLRAEEYESPRHIVQTYRQKYRSYLTNMPIPLQAFQTKDVKQAMKDVRRETIVVNSRVVASCMLDDMGRTLDGVRAIVDHLVKALPLLSDKMAKRDSVSSLTTRTSSSSQLSSSKSSLSTLFDAAENADVGQDVHATASSPVVTANATLNATADATANATANATATATDRRSLSSALDVEGESVDGNQPGDITPFLLSSMKSSLVPEKGQHAPSSSSSSSLPSMSSSWSVVSEGYCSFPESGTEDDTISSSSSRRNSHGDASSTASFMLDSEMNDRCSDMNEMDEIMSLMEDTMSSDTMECLSSVDENAWKAHLLSMLLNYTLLAASRTTAGGDAFIVLEDLFGGEGLMLSPFPKKIIVPMSPRTPSVLQSWMPYPLTSSSSSASRSSTPPLFRSTSASSLPPNSLPSTPGGNSLPNSPGGTAVELDPEATAITISSSVIKVVLKEKFNLFERRAVERCYCSSKVVPLVSFLCTTTTIISIAKLPAQSAETPTAAAAAPSTVTKFAGVTQGNATAGAAGATKTAAAAAAAAPAASERIRTAAAATAAKQPSSKQTLSDDRALYQFYQKLIACPEVVCGRAISIEPFLQ